jgi:hypothetical protein
LRVEKNKTGTASALAIGHFRGTYTSVFLSCPRNNLPMV